MERRQRLVVVERRHEHPNTLTVSEAGLYEVEITTPNCTFTYDLDVEDSPNQGVNLGADVLLCDLETVTFNSGYSASATTWISGGDAAAPKQRAPRYSLKQLLS